MFEQIYEWHNLLGAFRKAAKGKRGQANVAGFEYHLEDHLLQLQAELSTQTYRPGSYDSFYIHEPKKRLISAAPFRDRVVHHALCNLIEPVFECGFSPASFVNRKKMGTHRALDSAQQYLRRYAFFLQCDVRQFFPSIDHATLRSALARKIRDERVLWLCDQILASGRGVLAEEYEMVYFPGDNLLAALRPRGLPFLGFVLFPHHRRLKRRKGIHMARKLRRLAGEYRAGRLALDRLTASVQGWANHARYANTVGLRKAVLKQVRL